MINHNQNYGVSLENELSHPNIRLLIVFFLVIEHRIQRDVVDSYAYQIRHDGLIHFVLGSKFNRVFFSFFLINYKFETGLFHAFNPQYVSLN